MDDRNSDRPAEDAPEAVELTSILWQHPTGKYRRPEEKVILDSQAAPRRGAAAPVRRPDFEQTLQLRALKQTPPRPASARGPRREVIAQVVGVLLLAGAVLAALVVVLL